MKLTFLRAGDETRLVKKIDHYGRSIESYPMVRNVTSIDVEIKSIEDFYAAVKDHATRGNCLLKGTVDRQLVNESRAGHTNKSAETQWLCLDWDSEDEFATPKELVEELGFWDVDFIFQGSAKCGFSGHTRGHVFLLLDRPTRPDHIKNWVKHTNLSNEKIAKHIKLSKHNIVLCYPLDVGVNDNSKLIYIAPPEGPVDPMGENRYQLFKGHKRHVTLPYVEGNDLQQLESDKLNELRQALGLRRYTAKFKQISLGENRRENVLANLPGQIHITESYRGRGYIYFNLNGGDSNAYYCSEDDPRIIRNFKGEPNFLLADVDSELYQHYMEEKISKMPEGRPIAFRDPNTDTHYTARVLGEQATKVVKIEKSNIPDHFLNQQLDPPDLYPEIELIRDPHAPSGYHGNFINLWTPTQYMTLVGDNKAVPPTIELVLKNITGGGETYEHLLNWIAYIFQYRKPTGTLWLFHGEKQGTGKGTFYYQILKPLLGDDACYFSTIDALLDDKNAVLEGKLIYFVDEVSMSDVQRQQSRLWNKLKSLTCSEQLDIRAMRQDRRSAMNLLNFILASNDYRPLEISNADRRVNVAAPGILSLVELDPRWVETGYQRIDAELEYFAIFLSNYEVDIQRAKRPIMSQAREELIQASVNIEREFFYHVKNGNFDWLCQNTLHGQASLLASRDNVHYAPYEALQRIENHRYCVTTKDLMTLYNYLVAGMENKKATSPVGFGRKCAQYGLKSSEITVDGNRMRGFAIEFKGDPIGAYITNRSTTSNSAESAGEIDRLPGDSA